LSAAPYLTPAPGGVTLRLRVAPGASRDRISGVHGDALKIAVAAPPENGKANRAVVALLAEALGCRRADVTVVSGLASRDKVARIAGADAAAVRDRILILLGS